MSNHFLKTFKNPKVAFAMFAIWTIVFIGILKNMNAFTKKFLHFGPSTHPETQTSFLNYKLDTWAKVITVMLLGFVAVLFQSYYNQVIQPWMMNVILDPKAKVIDLPSTIAYTIAYFDPVLGWVNSILTFFITLTMQLQFIVPQLIADIITNALSVNAHLLGKKFKT